MQMKKKQIVIIGDSEDTPFHSECYAIGKCIAEKGHVLITGGRGGVMSAVSQGASEAGGIVVGILPGSDFDHSNEYCTIVIPTGIGYARNSINVLSGDLIIAIGGRAGTLSEIAFAWNFNKEIVLCTFAGGWSDKLSKTPIDDRHRPQVHIAHSVKEVCGYIEKICP